MILIFNDALLIKSHESHDPSKNAVAKTDKTKSAELYQEPFPQHLLDVPLAPTPPVGTPEKAKPQETAQKKQDKKDGVKRKEDSRRLLPYPDVKPPTMSQKRRREAELEKEKKEKIATGFYQSRSDEDDTLEKVNSLKEEQSDQSRKSRKRSMTTKKAQKDKEKVKNDDVNDEMKDVANVAANRLSPQKLPA